MKLSASQVQKFKSCERAYAYEYVEGKRPAPTVKQQFGKDVHSILERWLRDGIAPPDTPEGRVAQQGIRSNWLPTPSDNLLIEKEFLIPWFPELDVHMYGFIDCLDPQPEALLVVDHKSTSSLNWAKTPEELETDPQALIYALWAALEYKVPEVRARWVYYSASNPKQGPRRPTGALPVEVLFKVSAESYIDKIRDLICTTRKMVDIRLNKKEGKSCKPNPNSCKNYGGCPHRTYCDLDMDSLLDIYFA